MIGQYMSLHPIWWLSCFVSKTVQSQDLTRIVAAEHFLRVLFKSNSLQHPSGKMMQIFVLPRNKIKNLYAKSGKGQTVKDPFDNISEAW